MKQIPILTFIFLIFLSCNMTNENKKEIIEKAEITKQVIGKKFFDYDAIEHYQTDFDKLKIGELYDNKSKSKIDLLKEGVILGDIPHSISDLAFIKNLEQIGFKKTIVDKSKFKSIEEIFVEKTTLENIATACIYVYRDILIFKKESKVVGIAKICFDCLANQIKGTTANTENFGQDGDYGKLAKILQ
ncbi:MULTISPECIES: hypothetical protein [Chryseobacterium]|nr:MULTISPECIES: hypothetical protein [Chryseobacterium]QQV04497.1 hypothetical protein I6I61_05510 [Chryseobacterium sp. FDAARGOS 1104]